MKKKSSPIASGAKKGFIWPILFLIIADLVLLLFLKYHFNGLSLKDFSFTPFGNLLNIIFAFLNGVGILLLGRFSKKTSNLNIGFILTLQIISTIIHIIIFGHEYTKTGVPSFLLFITSAKRFYYMYLFIISQLIQFYILSLILNVFFTETKFVYLKAFFKMIFIVVVIVLYSFFYSVLKKHDNENFEKGKYETGVVLGAAVLHGNKPSTLFEGRIKKVFDLYNKGIIKTVQLTGGNAPGEKSEGRTASEYLKKLGVKQEDMFIEEKSSNTVEQIAYLKKRFRGVLEKKNFIIVSDEFHLVRAQEICNFFAISAESSASEYDITSEKLLYYRLRESVALLLFWFFAV